MVYPKKAYSSPTPNFNEEYPTVIFDMNYYWRLAMPTSEEYDKGNEKQFTWKDYALKIWKINHYRKKMRVKSFIFKNKSENTS